MEVALWFGGVLTGFREILLNKGDECFFMSLCRAKIV